MKPHYAEALAGTLKSPSLSDNAWTFKVTNHVPLSILLLYVSETGSLLSFLDNHVDPTRTREYNHRFASGSFLVLKDMTTGGFIGVIELNTNVTQYSLTPDILSSPNDIGAIPLPTTDKIIPSDSPSVVVGVGKQSNELIIRVQSWQKMSDSYTLAPKETRTVGSTSSSGMTRTSSTEESVSKMMNADSSFGWGPISASISLSLNTSSTTMQSVTVNEEETSYESSEVSNPNDYPVMNIRWQICETIYIVAGGKSATIISRVAPSVVKTYNLNTIESNSVKPALSIDTQNWWLEELRKINSKVTVG